MPHDTAHPHEPLFNVYYYMKKPDELFTVRNIENTQRKANQPFMTQWKTTLCEIPDLQLLAAIGAEVDVDDQGTYYIMLPFNLADPHKSS
jgi:hypothetical protein